MRSNAHLLPAISFSPHLLYSSRTVWPSRHGLGSPASWQPPRQSLNSPKASHQNPATRQADRLTGLKYQFRLFTFAVPLISSILVTFNSSRKRQNSVITWWSEFLAITWVFCLNYHHVEWFPRYFFMFSMTLSDASQQTLSIPSHTREIQQKRNWKRYFQTVNEYMGSNHPIMSLHERVLSVLSYRVQTPLPRNLNRIF